MAKHKARIENHVGDATHQTMTTWMCRVRSQDGHWFSTQSEKAFAKGVLEPCEVCIIRALRSRKHHIQFSIWWSMFRIDMKFRFSEFADSYIFLQTTSKLCFSIWGCLSCDPNFMPRTWWHNDFQLHLATVLGLQVCRALAWSWDVLQPVFRTNDGFAERWICQSSTSELCQSSTRELLHDSAYVWRGRSNCAIF